MMIDNVEKILDENVRPYINSHGGNIEVISIEDGVVKVLLLGHCSSCPSARLTFEDLVKTELIQNVPGVTDVVLESNISEDMLVLAKKILNRGRQEFRHESRY